MPGQPAHLTENISPARQLGNGAEGVAYGIVYKDLEYTQHVSTLLSQPCHHDEVLEVKCPDYVLLEFPDDIGIHWPQHFKLVDDRWILPMQVSKLGNSNYIKLTKGNSQQNPIRLYYSQFEFEMAAVLTFYKIQGATSERIVLDLNKPAYGMKGLDIRSLLVGISRVKYGDHLRIFPLHDCSLDHLRKLKHCPYLVLWTKLYNL